MKRYITILTIILLPFLAEAQLSYPDSLRKELLHATADSARYLLNSNLAGYYEETKPDSAIFYGEQGLIIARKNKKQLAIASALLNKAFPLRLNGKYGEALGYLMEALAILEDPSSAKNNWRFRSTANFFTELRLRRLSAAHHIYALLEADMGHIDQELFHYGEEIRVAEIVKDSFRIQVAYMNLGNTYQRLGNLDTALYYGLRSDSMAKASGRVKYNGWNLGNIGDVYFKQKNNGLAKKYYYEAFDISKKEGNEGALRASTGRLFRLYLSEKNADSSLYFAKQQVSSTFSNEIGFTTYAYENLYKAYALKGQSDSADKYLKLAFTSRDSAWNEEVKNLTDFQQLTTNEQLRLRELEKEKVEYQAKIRTWSLLAGLAVFLLIALLLFRNNRLKKRSNKVLENTLSNLRATQTQLIQSEKMASL
jgi:tetratricopeptide (TPR) repeat protein